MDARRDGMAAVSIIIAKCVRCISLGAGGSLELVKTFSVENRTRTYQPRQSRPFNDQFDRELPQEARTELSGGAPKTYRKSAPPPPPRKVIDSPPPTKRGRGVTILGAIAIVAFFLYAVSHTGGPLSSTAPPESRSVSNPSSQPVEVRRALPAVPRALPIEVRRALPAVPRALVTSQAPMWNWQPVRMPDGTLVQVSYQGELPSSAALPTRGRFIGEEWSTGNTSWIWMTPAGANFPSWVDP
jgi:hypothetical protein